MDELNNFITAKQAQATTKTAQSQKLPVGALKDIQHLIEKAAAVGETYCNVKILEEVEGDIDLVLPFLEAKGFRVRQSNRVFRIDWGREEEWYGAKSQAKNGNLPL
jgi:hypothetical protein